jgi:hypothetical protein
MSGLADLSRVHILRWNNNLFRYADMSGLGDLYRLRDMSGRCEL